MELSDVALTTNAELLETLLEHYNRLDVEIQRLLPLKRIHWPA